MKAATVGKNPMFDTVHERIMLALGVAANVLVGGGWLKEHFKNRGTFQVRHSDELGAVRQELRQEIKDLKAEHGKELQDLKTELKDARSELSGVRGELTEVRAENAALKLDFALQRERVLLMIQLVEMDDPSWRQIARTLKQPHDVDHLLAEHRHHAHKDSDGPRVLFVDDNEETVKVFRVVLELAGYRVDTAYNAIDGLALMVEANKSGDPFSVAIVDYMMKDMDGKEMVSVIEAHNAGHTRLAFFTAKDDAGEVLRAANLGHIPVWHKPMDRNVFVANVQKLMQ